MFRPANLGPPTPKPDPDAPAKAEAREEERIEAKTGELAKLALYPQALELHLSGKPMAFIAGQLGLKNAREARSLVESALDTEKSSKTDKMRELTELRLSSMLDAFWDKMRAGDAKAGGMVLEVIDHQCKLYGLNSPVEIKLRDSINDVLNVVQRICAPGDYAKVLAELAELGRTTAAGAASPGGAALQALAGYH